MLQSDRAGKQRFSRRQITKRAIQIGSDLDTKQTSVSKKNKVSTPAKEKTGLRRSKDVEETPPSLKDSSSIGDVSVSFLSSTPKPGKTQLSRRRPLSAVHESKISKTSDQYKNSQPQRASPRNSSIDQPNKPSSQTSSNRSKSTSRSKTSNTSSNDSKKASISQTRSSTSKIPNEGMTQSMKSTLTKASIVSSNSLSSSESSSTQKRRKQSEIDTSTTDAHLDNRQQKSLQKGKSNKQTTVKRKTRNEDSVTTKKKRKISVAETSVLVQNSDLSTERSLSVKEKTLQRKSNVTQVGSDVKKQKERASPELSKSSDSDISKRNKKSPVKRNRPDSTSTATNKKQKTTSLEGDKGVPVQRVMIIKDGENRKKSDLLDIDVALSCLTDTLNTEMEDCDSQREQTAIKHLHKYLVQDVSMKISDVQNVKKLQDNIRKSSQTLKERQKVLMSLQQKKAELLNQRRGMSDERQSADNMKEINGFLNGLKSLISQLSA